MNWREKLKDARTLLWRGLKYLWLGMSRQKPWLKKQKLETKLTRCLTIFDLTMFGIGSMVGAGLFVITGTVVRNKTGPAVFLAYFIAGMNAFLNSICYAELGARIPKAGSSYAYTYVAGGEVLAFLTGWMVILEYVLGISSTARGWSSALNSLFRGAIQNSTKAYLFKNYNPPSWLDNNPDILAFTLVMFLAVIILRGPKLTAFFNNAIAIISVAIAVFISLIMMFYPRQEKQFFAGLSHGGFFPFTWLGIFSGAGTCFYAYIGFDAVTLIAEEAINPKRDIPIAVAASVAIVILIMCLTSFALVWFQPWYLIDPSSAFTAAFFARGLNVAGYISGTGMLISITSSLFSSLFAMPKIIYAMSIDGLLPRWLAYLLPSTKVPAVALLIFSTVGAVMAALFTLEVLADFLSIGTLFAFTIVNLNLCVLRYQTPSDVNTNKYNRNEMSFSKTSEVKPSDEVNEIVEETTDEDIKNLGLVGTLKPEYNRLTFLQRLRPGLAPVLALMTMTVFAAAMCCLILLGYNSLFVDFQVWALLLLIIFLIGLLLSLAVMMMHYQGIFKDSFSVPLVPILPAICICFNFFLIMSLPALTWLRIFIWILAGLLIYFFYGIHHSKLRSPEEDAPLL